MEYMKLLSSDPNDPNVQKKIEEIIKQKNINENLKYAEEYLPETLFAVHMLFIHLEINKKKVIALVDTGAQSTIMSKELVEKCNLMNLVDTRYSGIAQGVGTSKIIGTIHAAQLKIHDKFLMCKITVIENPTIGFIFGLDNMRTYRCNIDLGKNALIFPDANIKAEFLSDGELAKIREDEEIEKEKEDIQKATEASFQKK
jgi:DNA damage-inducible protein 1